jgi:hypothetical protein
VAHQRVGPARRSVGARVGRTSLSGPNQRSTTNHAIRVTTAHTVGGEYRWR